MSRPSSPDPRSAAPDLSGEADAHELAGVWDLLGDAAPRSPRGDVDGAWARLEARLDAESGAAPARVAPATRVASPSTASPWRRAAAVAALLLVGGAGVWNGVPATAEAGPGERVQVVLPGGTQVALNAGSSLRWARGFSWLPGVDRGDRVVHLSGEAFFDVTRDGRPFRVETSHARVRVLGTRFNVRVRPGEGTLVAVDEGSVEVVDAAASAVVLTAGQRVTAGQGALRVLTAGADPVAAWRRGGFSATDAPLASVVQELERRWDVEIRTGSLPASSLERRLTLYYSGPVELEAVLDDVVTTLGLRYRQTAGGWEVLPAP